jgi:hypothetical protein
MANDFAIKEKLSEEKIKDQLFKIAHELMFRLTWCGNLDSTVLSDIGHTFINLSKQKGRIKNG